MNEAVLLSALAIVASCVAVLSWVIKFMFTKIMPALENNNTLTAKGIKMTEANTAATKSADEYLRERNGRDNEHHTAVLESINEIPKIMQKIADAQSNAIIKAVSVKKQSVTEQRVEHQTVVKEKK